MNFTDHVLEIGSNNRKIALYAEEALLLSLREAKTEVAVVEDVDHTDWVITFSFIIIEYANNYEEIT